MKNKVQTVSPAAMTGGWTLARNTLWNLLGSGAPLLVAVFAIPVLIEALGVARFGVLTLAWTVVGYFSLFDLGLGRALTKLVAEKLGAGLEREIPSLIWTALALIALLGVIGIAVAAVLSPWLVYRVLKIPGFLQTETLRAFYLLAVSIPIVVSTAGLRGVLEAYQRFDLTNAVRIPLGMFTFLGPMAVLPFSKSLFPIVAALLAVRFLAWGAHLLLCLHVVPALSHEICTQYSMIRPLMSFGGWMTVTNIISPVMVYFDRFLIGAMISMSAVTYYATPYEVITKLGVIPGALVGVLFPAFSTEMVKDQVRASELFGQGMNYVFLVLFPLTLVVVTMAHEGMKTWLGGAFADKSTFVLQWLAVGVFLNSLARISFALVQGAGRPDLTAKLHTIELPVYILMLWWMLSAYGIRGAAVAWVMRISIDILFLFVMVQWLLPNARGLILDVLLRAIIAICIFVIAGYTAGLFIKSLFLTGVLICFLVVAWRWLLSPHDQRFIKKIVEFRKN